MIVWRGYCILEGRVLKYPRDLWALNCSLTVFWRLGVESPRIPLGGVATGRRRI